MMAGADQASRIGLRRGGGESDVEAIKSRWCESQANPAEEMATVDGRGRRRIQGMVGKCAESAGRGARAGCEHLGLR